MKKLIIQKFDSFLLSFTTILYAIQIMVFPNILARYQVYQIIDEYFNRFEIGILFLVLASLTLCGVILNKPKLRRYSLSALTAIWLLFSISFAISSPPNTMWILSGSLACLSFGIALKESV